MENNSVKNKRAVAGVVVLYNPDNSVLDNINTYINKLGMLFAIDNSENPNEDLILKLKNNPKVTYFPFHENLGIAKALNKGAELAIEHNYTWLLTMDQDSQFMDVMIHNYINCFDNVPDIDRYSIVTCNHFNPEVYQLLDKGFSIDNKLPTYTFKECLMVITSGNLLNLNLYKSIGPFDEKLFIDCVDHDYCLRSNVKGYKIIQFDNIYLNHKLGSPKKVKRKIFNFPKTGIISLHSSMRMYYITRNTLYIIKKYFKYYPRLITRLSLRIMIVLSSDVAFDDHKIKKIININKGILDFIVGRYGKQ